MYTLRLPYREKDEKILLVLRRFWPIFFRSLLLILFFFVLPLIAYVMILNFAPEFLETLFFQILGLLCGLYWLFILLYALISWINYYFDVWIVTSKRIINIEQVSLFERVTSETRLEMIQDVTVEVKGFLPSVFHFGNVYVQTAAERARFAFEQIRWPYKVKKLISDLHRKALREEEIKYAKPAESKRREKEIKYREPKLEKPKPEEPQEGLGKISDYRK